MRNIRDYKAQIRPNSESPGSASPFNIVTKSLTLQNFTKDEIIQLYMQHTGETGQNLKSVMETSIWRKALNKPSVTWTSTTARKGGWWFSTA
jgi:hypothetical protein